MLTGFRSRDVPDLIPYIFLNEIYFRIIIQKIRCAMLFFLTRGCLLGNFACFLSSADFFFQNHIFSKKFFHEYNRTVK